MAFRAVWTVDWVVTGRRVWAEMALDDCFGAAAQIAFYFMLGFFPFVIALAALATTLAGLPPGELERSALSRLSTLMPPQAFELVESNIAQLMRTLEGANVRLLVVSTLLSLWPASGALRAVIVTLNRAYNVREGRGPWRLYIVSMALTLALCLTAILALPFLSFASSIRAQLLATEGPQWAAAFGWGGRIAAVMALILGIEFVYHVAPNARRPWHWITAGSIVAVFLWMLATWGFSKYVVHFGRYEALYAGLGAPIVLLLWFYLSGLALLVGGEINAEIERQSGIMTPPAVPAPPNVDAAGHDTTLHEPPPVRSTARARPVRRRGGRRRVRPGSAR